MATMRVVYTIGPLSLRSVVFSAFQDFRKPDGVFGVVQAGTERAQHVA